MMITRAGTAIVGFCLVACATVPPPNEREASSQAAVRGAQEVGADKVPEAALEMKLAQEQIDKGKNLIKSGDNERADYVLMRAQADAELAVALAHESKARVEAQPIIDKARGARGAAPGTAAQPSNP